MWRLALSIFDFGPSNGSVTGGEGKGWIANLMDGGVDADMPKEPRGCGGKQIN